MKKYFFLLFLMINFVSFAEWIEEDRVSDESITSVKLFDADSGSKALVVISSNIDGNLSLVYVASLAVNELDDVALFKNYSYGYEKEEKKFMAIKVTDNGIVYVENTVKENLLKALESFDESDFSVE